jgi:NAD(P)-dependent dehydrogenase (short-subunit alcohol dehydrogenase family)
MSANLDNKVAVVTGAAKGIGFAIAKALSDAGAKVVVSDIDGAAAEAAAARLPNAVAMTCDVTSEDQVAGLVTSTVDDHGAIDILVANAGTGNVSPIVAMTLEDWRSTMAVNLDGVFLCNKHAAGAMAAAGGGSIINIASIKAFGGAPVTASYGAAKAGVVSLTKTLAMEMRDSGVRVNAVCPGWADTDMVNDNKAHIEAALGISFDEYIDHVQKRLATADEIAGVVVFLASDRARFSSGSTYNVDGGATASLV